LRGRNKMDKITISLDVDSLIIQGINLPRYIYNIDYQEIFN